MKKRMLTLASALALMLSLLTTAHAADVTLTVKTPETIPRAGEEFTVTVDISGNPGLCAAQLVLEYDRDAVDCKNVWTETVLEKMLAVTNGAAEEGAIVAAASTEPARKDGPMAAFVFVAKVDLTGYSFKLNVARLTGADSEQIPFTVEGAELNVLDHTVKTTPTKPTKPSKPSTPSKPTAQEQPTQPDPQPQKGGAATPETAEDATETGFTDVPPTFWGAKWITEAAKRGLFKGTPDGRFNPDAPISRADYVLVLHRMAGEPEPQGAAPFSDVPEDAYYADAVAWAYEKGYVNGKGDGFAPTDSLTRQEAMKILFGYAGGQSGGELLLTGVYDSGFTDSGEIAAWAKPAMYWAYYKSIISGTSATTLSPTATATRAQLAKILVGYQDMKN